VNNLVVDGHLKTIIIDDEDANATTAIVERLREALRETALVKDGKALLDVTALSHGNNAAILTDVKNTVLLEDGTEHVLNNNGRSWVGDEAGLLMELLGEEVNTQVAVLAGLGGGGDANDLTRAALKDQEIANADVVAGDGDGGRRFAGHFDGWAVAWSERLVSGSGRRGVTGSRAGSRVSMSWSRSSGARGGWGGVRGVGDANDLLDWHAGLNGTSRGGGRSSSGVLLLDDYLFLGVLVPCTLEGVFVRVVMAVRVEWVSDVISYLVGGFGNTSTE